MTLLIVDGPNLMMRALYAAQGTGMSTLEGDATGALVIFINTLTKHIREEQPSHVVVTWEGHEGAAFRRKLLPSYKANRKQFSDNGLQDVGFDLAELFLVCCDIPSRSRPGYEADDLIAAYWAHANPHHVDKIVVLSSDKDMLQLTGSNPHGVPTEQVRVSSHGADTDRWDAERTTAHYGVPPAVLPALMAIMGDDSDGIAGVPGLGPKKGARLLHEHDLSLHKAFTPDSKYVEYRERVLINYDLINLRDVDLYELPPRLFVAPQPGDIRWNALVNFCERYELTKIYERILTGALWRPGQDGPVRRKVKLSAAQTPARRS